MTCTLNDCFFFICLVNGFIGTFVLLQCNKLLEVRKYKSCGVFISFVLIFEHCNFVDNYRLSGKLQEVRKYKSCGVFISFVLIFEHCNFVDSYRLSGKIGPDMSTKKFLNDNSPSSNTPLWSFKKKNSCSLVREVGHVRGYP